MITHLKRAARAKLDDLRLPAAAKDARRRDHSGLPSYDPGIEAVETAALAWLCAAQDCSASTDGGAARHYSLVQGWGTSYPETSGYIVPTLIDAAHRRGDEDLLVRARRMLDWLVSIQLPGGGFPGGMVGQTPVVPVTFNTGQILMGLAAGTRAFGGQYAAPMHAAASWLADTLDPDGCWRSHPTPFAQPGEKAYETHVSWGLVEAARVSDDPALARKYADAAERNARWAISHQRENGWFDRCCLDTPDAPLTHTIGYVLRGIVEIYLYGRDPELLAAARRTADALATCVATDGYLPGRLDSGWNGAVSWVCLTGSAQNAHALLLLYRETGEVRYRDTAFSLLQYVRRTVVIDGPPEIRGGVKGSFPLDGGYGRYQFLNWAAKFLIDACGAERRVRQDGSAEPVAETDTPVTR